MANAFELIEAQIADPDAQWSLGTFGAIAEFMRDADEPAEIAPGRAIDLGRDAARRHCASRCARTCGRSHSRRSPRRLEPARRVLPARGGERDEPARGADRGWAGPRSAAPQDRDALLFDLGLGVHQVDCCIRTAEPELIAGLRAAAGRSLFEPGNPAMGLILRHSPHRVFATRAGRAEVYQPIPAPGGTAPDGPHTHVLPKLLAHKRTHAATEPIPRGFVSCAHLYPAHPLRDGYGRAIPFDSGRYAAFQRLLSRFGDIEHVKLKRNVVKALNAGAGPEAIAMPADRFAQASIRIALRQVKASGGPSAALTAWFAAHDTGAVDDPDELGEA